MADRFYDQVRVVVYDSVAANLNVTRSSLFELGFRQIDATRDFDRFAAAAVNGECELIVAEQTSPEGDVLDVVRRVRAGEDSVNPFLVAILTSWHRSERDVRRAIDSGADDVLARPLSTASLRDRVRVLVDARKAFIVTGDYIGPDRRADPTRPANLQAFDPPNTLKAVADGDLEAMSAAMETIEAVRDDMERERIRRLSMRVATAARLRMEAGGDADAFGAEEIDRAARELRRRLKARGQTEAVELASALTGVTASLIQDGDDAERSLSLARDLAFGAYAAFAGATEQGRSREEVDQIVSSIKSRLRANRVANAG